MRSRGLAERARVMLPTRPVTCTVTPRQVELYLRQTGWQRRDDELGSVPDARDRAFPIADVIEKIAQYEGRYPGDVLADIAAGRGLERWVRRQKRWPAWP